MTLTIDGKIVGHLILRNPDNDTNTIRMGFIIVDNTICAATRNRQEETLEMSKNVDKMIANPDDSDLINYYYDDFYEIYQYNTFNSVDKLNDKFLELLFDYVDENFAGEENDFVSRGEREYNSDETYENVSNESTYDLMVKFFDKNDADTFLDRLSELEDIKNYIDKHLLHNSSDEQDEDSGDEYDE